MALYLLITIAYEWKMDQNVFLMLEKDTMEVLLLLFSLRQYYIKNKHQIAVHKIDDDIVVSNVSLIMIERELAELEGL